MSDSRASLTVLVARWRPSRDEAVDLAAVLALTILGLVGFSTAYGSSGYLVVGVAGALVGASLGVVLVRERLPVLIGTAVALLGYVVLASFVLRDGAIAGVIPTPGTLVAVFRQSVNGWAKLVTAVPPVGDGDHLLAVPLLCGYAASVLAVSLALTVHRLPLCIVPPLAVLALSILFGTNAPASLVLQGGFFAALAIGWMSHREGRKRNILVDAGSQRRLLTGGALLAVATLGAVAVGPHLPLAGARPRFVLREHAEPPFDPRQYPSPLIGLRRYLDDTRLKFKDTVLFTVAGLPEGARIRLATMDEYDGVVWSVTGRDAELGGTFERVGDEIPQAAASGKMTHLDFQVMELPQAVATKPSVWMPVAGVTRAVTFTGPRRDDLAESFRFNSVSETAAMPIRLAPGDGYEIDTVLAVDPAPGALAGRPVVNLRTPFIPELPLGFADVAAKRTAGAVDAYGKARKLEEWLRNGYYSDGGKGTTIAPGHSIRRLSEFVAADQPVGDAEQYAAAMAVLARTLGLPARVVLGFTAPASEGGAAQVRGRDVDAWLEIPFAGAGWTPFYPTPARDRTPPDEQSTAPTARSEEPVADAPAVTPTTIRQQDAQFDDADELPTKKDRLAHPERSGPVPALVLVVVKVAGVPLVVFAGLAGAVVGAKAGRRRRRRNRGGPAARIAAAWAELVDNARDRGRPVPAKATRVEAAVFLATPGGVAIAEAVDAALFGLDEPTEAEVGEVWGRVDAAVHAVAGALPRQERAWAAVSLTSLRPWT